MAQRRSCARRRPLAAGPAAFLKPRCIKPAAACGRLPFCRFTGCSECSPRSHWEPKAVLRPGGSYSWARGAGAVVSGEHGAGSLQGTQSTRHRRPAADALASAPGSAAGLRRGSFWGVSMGGEGSVPASPCFSSIAQLKGEVNVQLMKQFPFGRLIFQNHFCLERAVSPSLRPAASVGLTLGLGAPPNASFLSTALSAPPWGSEVLWNCSWGTRPIPVPVPAPGLRAVWGTELQLVSSRSLPTLWGDKHSGLSMTKVARLLLSWQ